MKRIIALLMVLTMLVGSSMTCFAKVKVYDGRAMDLEYVLENHPEATKMINDPVKIYEKYFVDTTKYVNKGEKPFLSDDPMQFVLFVPEYGILRTYDMWGNRWLKDYGEIQGGQAAKNNMVDCAQKVINAEYQAVTQVLMQKGWTVTPGIQKLEYDYVAELEWGVKAAIYSGYIEATSKEGYDARFSLFTRVDGNTGAINIMLPDLNGLVVPVCKSLAMYKGTLYIDLTVPKVEEYVYYRDFEEMYKQGKVTVTTNGYYDTDGIGYAIVGSGWQHWYYTDSPVAYYG